jgi:adenine/guanine/hypoxanthine permease
MIRQVVNINWRYIGDAVPAFVTLMFIPFGYSAAYGLIAGLMAYTALNGMIFVTKLITRGYVVPDDEDNREYWTSEQFPQSKAFLTLTTSTSCPTRQAALVHHHRSEDQPPLRIRQQ